MSSKKSLDLIRQFIATEARNFDASRTLLFVWLVANCTTEGQRITMPRMSFETDLSTGTIASCLDDLVCKEWILRKAKRGPTGSWYKINFDKISCGKSMMVARNVPGYFSKAELLGAGGEWSQDQKTCEQYIKFEGGAVWKLIPGIGYTLVEAGKVNKNTG